MLDSIRHWFRRDGGAPQPPARTSCTAASWGTSTLRALTRRPRYSSLPALPTWSGSTAHLWVTVHGFDYRPHHSRTEERR